MTRDKPCVCKGTNKGRKNIPAWGQLPAGLSEVFLGHSEPQTSGGCARQELELRSQRG